MARPNEAHPLPGSERPQIKGSTLVGGVEADEHMTVAVIVRQKPGSAEVPDLEHWQSTPPDKRVYLSQEEFFERHGAVKEEVDRVADYLKERGLRIVEQHAGRRRIVADGTTEQMNGAFGVTLNRYRAPERTEEPAHPPRKEGEGRPFGDHREMGAQEYRGFEGLVHLPANLVELVEAVIGLLDTFADRAGLHFSDQQCCGSDDRNFRGCVQQCGVSGKRCHFVPGRTGRVAGAGPYRYRAIGLYQ
jgi:hypothetical protein